MRIIVTLGKFEWDDAKNRENIRKHHLDFATALAVFEDPHALWKVDLRHSTKEMRWVCISKAGGRIVTVRLTFRGSNIRIIGAGYWRRGRKCYEEKSEEKKENSGTRLR